MPVKITIAAPEGFPKFAVASLIAEMLKQHGCLIDYELAAPKYNHATACLAMSHVDKNDPRNRIVISES
ncbi:hypothetical protein [Burkholderia phage BCSR5]|nr:hypothetical protein [Burkholderia phage BCSR5]